MMVKSLRKKLGKRAQFYILTAIVLIGFSTLLLSSKDVVPGNSGTFSEIYRNFKTENPAAINNIYYEGKDVDLEYGRFLDRFMQYAKQRKVSLEVFAVISTGERIYFISRMDNPSYIIDFNETVWQGQSTYFVQNVSSVTVELGDDVFHENIYKFSIPGSAVEAKAVLRMKKGDDREIFTVD